MNTYRRHYLKAMKRCVKRSIKRSAKRSARREKGSVLFIVLVVIISLVAMVAISAMKMETDVQFVTGEMDKLRAYTMCISGKQYLENRLLTGRNDKIELLAEDRKPFSPRLFMDGSDIVLTFGDILQGDYAKTAPMDEIDDMGFVVSIQDSAGLINILRIDRALFKQFLKHSGFDPGRGDIFIDSVFDWVDPDDLVRPNGAETSFYSKQYGYGAANRLIDSRDQFAMIRGMDNRLFSEIGHLIDFSVPNRVMNPNTMPEELFYMFPGLREDSIRRIVEKRREQAFENVGDLTFISGYNFSSYPRAFGFFTSRTSYVKIKASMNDQRDFCIQLKLERIGAEGGMRRGTAARRLLNPGSKKRETHSFTQYYLIRSYIETTEIKIPEEANIETSKKNPPLTKSFAGGPRGPVTDGNYRPPARGKSAPLGRRR